MRGLWRKGSLYIDLPVLSFLSRGYGYARWSGGRVGSGMEVDWGVFFWAFTACMAMASLEMKEAVASK